MKPTYENPLVTLILRDLSDESSNLPLSLKRKKSMDLSGNVTTVPNFNKIKNCNLVVEVGAIQGYIQSRGYSEDEGKQCLSSMLLGFIHEPQEWLRDYHTRSISESVFSAFKRCFPCLVTTTSRGCLFEILEEIYCIGVWDT